MLKSVIINLPVILNDKQYETKNGTLRHYVFGNVEFLINLKVCGYSLAYIFQV